VFSPVIRKDDPILPNKTAVMSRKMKFRRLREGDEVREGQILAVLDPARDVDDLQSKVAKLDAADADQIASAKTREEAKQRLATAEQLYQKRALPLEEYRAARLTLDRYIYETISKEQAITVAASDVRSAGTVLNYHIIRSEITAQIKT